MAIEVSFTRLLNDSLYPVLGLPHCLHLQQPHTHSGRTGGPDNPEQVPPVTVSPVPPLLEEKAIYLLEVDEVTFQLPARTGAFSPLLRKQLRPIALLPIALLPLRYCSMVQTVPDHQERYFQGPSA